MTKRRTKRGRRRSKGQRYEAAGTLVLGKTQANRRTKVSAQRLRWVAYTGAALVVVLAAAGLWLGLDGRFYVSHAEVVGAARLAPEAVFRASGLPGIHVLWIRAERVEAQILDRFPSVQDVEVRCGVRSAFLGDCVIAIEEREPRVMWETDGQAWWIDASGVVFPAYGTIPGRWLVRGPLPLDENGHLDRQVAVGLAELGATGAEVAQEFEYLPDRGLVFVDAAGWRVFLGQGPGMAQRLSVLEQLRADLQGRGVTPRFVDVRFPEAPYYSLVNDW